MFKINLLNNFAGRVCLIGASILAIISSSGCQSTQPGQMPTFAMPTIVMPKVSMPSMQALNPMKMFNKDKQAKNKIPNRMAVIWKDASISDVGKPTTRGLGGRVYFYDENNDPVEVDGELVIYGYNDGENESTNSADRKYVFEQKDLKSHFSETDIGPSYSFWVPWDKAGGLRKTVGLVPVFKDASGKLVQGGHSLCVLNGKAPAEQTLARTDVNRVSQFDTRTAMNGNQGSANENGFAGAQVNHIEEQNQNRMRTSTIKVPRNMARQMKNTVDVQNAMVEAQAQLQARQALKSNDMSPLLAQLQAQNKLANGQAVSYGSNQQPSTGQKDETDSDQAHTQAGDTGSTNAAPTTAKRRPSVFGRPGSFR